MLCFSFTIKIGFAIPRKGIKALWRIRITIIGFIDILSEKSIAVSEDNRKPFSGPHQIKSNEFPVDIPRHDPRHARIFLDEFLCFSETAIRQFADPQFSFPNPRTYAAALCVLRKEFPLNWRDSG